MRHESGTIDTHESTTCNTILVLLLSLLLLFTWCWARLFATGKGLMTGGLFALVDFVKNIIVSVVCWYDGG